MLRLYTFGGLRIERDGQPLQLPTQKARDLLAYLIAFRGRPHPRVVLAGALWPDLPEDKARRRLSDALWRVRRAVGPDIILADEVTLQLNADGEYWLDVERFERQLDRPPDSSIALPTLHEAIELYSGPFLDGFYDDWVLLEQERLRELYLETLEQLLEQRKQGGDYAAALAAAQRLVAAEPLHETAHRELMRLYHLLDRDAEAVAQYHRCREILQEELSAAPTPETEALYHVLSHRLPSPPGTPTVHLPAAARHPLSDLDRLPLVGRDAERAALLAHLEAAASGRGGIILLEGEPGIGKSRLAQELVAGAQWRNVTATIAQAEERAASSYALLLAALAPAVTALRMRQLMRLMEPADLQAVVPLFPQMMQHLPELPSLPDVPPPQARERLQQALVTVVLSLARLAPHLWVLEDLQWADAETLFLLPLLLPHLAESQALFVLTGRSAELRADPAVWEILQALDRAGPLPRCALTRLHMDDIGCLVRHLLNEEKPALANHLARESEGVPLYLVETLKAWQDEDHLLPSERGGWRWQGDVPTAPLAQPGEAVIGHRLSHLSPAAEEVLNAAAVIGTEVDFDLLAYVCALSRSTSNVVDPDGYLLVTNDLLRLGFLTETDRGYRFSHEQVRRAVSHRLSPEQRRHLHRQVAQALETLFPEQLELLAHHFLAAGEREPAISHLTRAAEQARGLFAHETALACFHQLLDLLIHPEDRPARFAVLSDRAEVLGWVGDREAQGRDLEEMLNLAKALSNDACLASALHRRSEWHRLQGRYEPANENALAALEIYRRLGDDRDRATLLIQLGRNVVYSGDLPRASAYFEEALPIYEALGDLEGQINCLSGLTAAAELAGDYFAALTYVQQNMALAETSGATHRISRALHNFGVIYHDLGNLDAAEANLNRALRLKEMTRDRHSEALTHFYLGMVATDRGNFGSARKHLTTALEILREVQGASWEGDTLAALGRMALLEDDPATALEYLRAAHQRRLELDEPNYAVVDLSYMALAKLALEDEDAAWQYSQMAVTELRTGLPGVEHPQRITHNHFRIAQATHRWAAARAALEAAAKIVDERAARIKDLHLREKYRTGHPVNRAIAQALESLPSPGCLRVCLARADAPAHRRPAPDETVALTWTVDAGEADAALAEREGKIALRRQRILRLLAEAEAAGGSPTVADLAGALEVSPRTIDGDLAALRRQGHPIRTRGCRG